MNKLAVILPTYNAEHFLIEAIDAISNQSFKEFDLYIIDDCSTDNTEYVVKSIVDTRIKYIKNSKNLGIAATLNRALKLVLNKYEYIARMDADDWCFSDRFNKQISFLDANKSIVLCGTQGYWLTDFSKINSSWRYPTDHLDIKYHLLFAACFGHSSVMFRSTFLKNFTPWYDEDIRTCEDWDFWTRIIKKGEVANLPYFLMKYRIFDGSNHRSEENKQIHLKERSKVIANHWKSFNIECDENFIFDVYFSKKKKSKVKLESEMLKLIDMSNRLYDCALDELNQDQINKLRYRLLRNLKRNWGMSNISKFSIDIWSLIIRHIRFSSVFYTFKTIMR